MINSNKTKKNFHATEVLKKIGRPIAYYPAIARTLGSVKTAIFVCQFLYWEGKQRDQEGWIYKTAEEILEETGLSRAEQEGARKRLKDLGILREKKKSLPAKLYYLFDWEKFDQILSEGEDGTVQTRLAKTAKLDSGFSPNLIGEKCQPIYTENTDRDHRAEITQKKEGQPSVTSVADAPSGRATLGPFFSGSDHEDNEAPKGEKNDSQDKEQPSVTSSPTGDSGRATLGRGTRPPAESSLAYAIGLAEENCLNIPDVVFTDVVACAAFISGIKSGRLVDIYFNKDDWYDKNENEWYEITKAEETKKIQ